MNKPVVIIGLGEMGGVFARGFLRSGIPVFPINRTMNISTSLAEFPEFTTLLVAVAEHELHDVLDRIPDTYLDRITLLQNELLPRDWLRHNISNPTVISVWFEKKKGQDTKLIIPSPVFGPNAALLCSTLGRIDISCRIVTTKEEMLFELVRKNVYILTVNIAGLIQNGTVENLWQHHQELATDVANEIIDIQEWLTGDGFDRESLIRGMVEAIHGDPRHQCTGRSAPERLDRALNYAVEAGIKTPCLMSIKSAINQEPKIKD